MATIIPRTKIAISEDFKEIFTEREFLFGMIKWWELSSREKISNTLYIKIDIEIKYIYKW